MVHQICKSETITSPVVATSFWQAFISSPTFSLFLQRAGASPTALVRGEAFVVRHGTDWPRHDLIVFDPDFAGSKPAVLEIKPRMEDLSIGWEQFRIRRRLVDPKFQIFGGAATEALGAHPFALIVTKPPRKLFTHCPNPAWEVSSPNAPGESSTAGVLARNNAGKEGVTVSNHAIKGAAQVTVNGWPGTVLSSDAISDSCFVEVPGMAVPAVRTVKGFLKDVTPRQYETVHFDGFKSGTRSTTVTAWSPDLVYVRPYSQLKVLTQPDTNPGDSGAALIDSTDHIIGFAFYRTGFGEIPEYSAWIWAHSVFEAHKLTVL
jgi:hypothetical protein